MTGLPLQLGRVVATPDALRLIEEEFGNLAELLRRHHAGDWGDVPRHDAAANRAALQSGARVLSAYTLPRGGVVWVLTDAATDACPACIAGLGVCEPEKGEWLDGIHFRTDEPARRLSTTVLLPSDY